MTACTAFLWKITFGTSTNQPPEMYEQMGYIHVGMWSDPGKNICIFSAPCRCCWESQNLGRSRRARMGLPLPVIGSPLAEAFSPRLAPFRRGSLLNLPHDLGLLLHPD